MVYLGFCATRRRRQQGEFDVFDLGFTPGAGADAQVKYVPRACHHQRIRAHRIAPSQDVSGQVAVDVAGGEDALVGDFDPVQAAFLDLGLEALRIGVRRDGLAGRDVDGPAGLVGESDAEEIGIRGLLPLDRSALRDDPAPGVRYGCLAGLSFLVQLQGDGVPAVRPDLAGLASPGQRGVVERDGLSVEQQRDGIGVEPVVVAEREAGAQREDGSGPVEAHLGAEDHLRDGRCEGFGEHMRLAGLLRAEADVSGPVRVLAEFGLPGVVAAGDDPLPEHDVLGLSIPLGEHFRAEELVGVPVEILGIAAFRERLRVRDPFVAQGDHGHLGAERLAAYLQDGPERAVEIHGDVAQVETGREGGLAVDRERAVGVAILPGQVVFGLEACRVPVHGETFGFERRFADGLAVGIPNREGECVGVGGVGRRAERQFLVPLDPDPGDPVRNGSAGIDAEGEGEERNRAEQWKMFHIDGVQEFHSDLSLAQVLYAALSSSEAVLYPAIRLSPLPMMTRMPVIRNRAAIM